MKSFFRGMQPHAVPIACYALVVAVVFGRALIPGATEMIWGDDIHRSYYFYRQFFNNFLSQGIWPWWNPYNLAGTPFLAHPIVNILYPPSWLYIVLPLNLAYSWHIALHLLWAMTGTYTLLRRVMTNDQILMFKQNHSPIPHPSSLITYPPAWIGGLVFGLSGFFTARIWAGHVDVIAAASWMPWVVAAFAANFKFQISNFKLETNIQKHQNKRGIVIAGVVLAMQLFAGYQTMAMFTLEAVGIITVITLIVERASIREVIAVACRIAVSVLLAIGLFAVVLVPQQEFFRQTIRTYTLPYFWNAYGSLTWQSLGQFINPFFFGDQLTYHGPPPNFAEHAFFVGRVGMLIVGLAAIVWIIRLFMSSSRKRGSSISLHMDFGSPHQDAWQAPAGMTQIVAFLTIALFGIWVSLGPNAPFDLQYILWKAIPMYHFLRIPPRHLILVGFGLSGLVGIAIHFLNHKSQIPNHKQITRTNVQNSKRFGIWNFLHFEFVWNLMLDAWNLLQFFIIAIIAVEMILYAHYFIVLKPLPETRHDTQLIRILKQDKDPYRVLTNFGAWAPPRDSFDFDAGMHYGVFNATGYDTMILKPYYAFIDASNGATIPSILEHDVQIPYLDVFSKATDLLNIKYILHPRGYDPLAGTKDPRFRLIREDVARDYRLYENTTVLPRFFFENDKEGRVEIEKYSPNEIILSIQSTVGDTLASSEMYYPGWEGFVDGAKVDVMKVNNAFRALFVPAGRHTVVYRYNPRIFMIGGMISLITAGIMVFLWKKSYDVGASL